MTHTIIIKSDNEPGTATAVIGDSNSFIETSSTSGIEPTNSTPNPQEAVAPLTDRDLYPHFFDESSGVSAAQATSSLREAIIDMEEVSDLILEPDFHTAWAALGSAGAKIKRAEQFSSFNSALRGICIYCRKAIHKADATQLSQQSVQAMIVVIRRLADNPTISLATAADLADTLEDHGWDGNNPLVDEIVNALSTQDKRSITTQPESNAFAGGDN
ncbi:hypothetical protein J2W49_003509 [Hydrogenophaga palleronii]|uniref:Uncharacterized protein n=1 Tax=Hydrogenophaga palleronii TaxID=65655 RepID=A0ABU1WQF2_9BURK|nr:hypothetical protein [Hydrogenophaga palleronii]MDR7151533.1 hypothetical protein [Hydrogenophaga palleronii]